MIALRGLNSFVAASTTASVAGTLPSAPAAGSLLLAAGHGATSGSGQLSITGFTKLIEQTYDGGTRVIALFYKLADGTESTITLNGKAGENLMKLHCGEWVGNANPIFEEDEGGSSTAGATSLLANQVNNIFVNELVYAIWGVGGGNVTAPSIDSGFRISQQDASIRMFSGFKMLNSLTTTQPTGSWTTSRAAGSLIAAFRAAYLTETLRPNAAGDAANNTVTGTNNFTATSDDDDTTYLRNNTATDKEDDLNLGASALTNERILSIDVRCNARSETSATGVAKLGLRLSSTNSTLTTLSNFPTAALMTPEIAQNIPRPGGGDWTVADLANLQVVLVTNNGGGTAIRVGDLYVDVNYAKSLTFPNRLIRNTLLRR